MDANLYHAHHQLHLEDLPFWKKMASVYGQPVLELGCGTGRVLIPLLQDGVKIAGLDFDPAMLSHLRAGLPPDLQKKTYLVQADMCDFDLHAKFPLIILPCNTFSTFTSGERRQILERVRQHLPPEGRFVLSMPNPEVLLDMPHEGEPELEEDFPHPDTGEKVEVISSWQRGLDTVGVERFTITWIYQVGGQRVEDAETAETGHVLDELAVYEEDLRSTDFLIERTWGDYDFSPFNEGDTYWIVVAARGA